MSMRYEDFWFNYDLRELGNAIQGYSEKEERQNKESWEQIRLIYAAVLNKPVYGYKIKPEKPIKMLPFPWDNDSKPIEDEVIKNLRQEIWQQGQ